MLGLFVANAARMGLGGQVDSKLIPQTDLFKSLLVVLPIFLSFEARHSSGLPRVTSSSSKQSSSSVSSDIGWLASSSSVWVSTGCSKELVEGMVEGLLFVRDLSAFHDNLSMWLVSCKSWDVLKICGHSCAACTRAREMVHK
jgi:hypothetical protein